MYGISAIYNIFYNCILVTRLHSLCLNRPCAIASDPRRWCSYFHLLFRPENFVYIMKLGPLFKCLIGLSRIIGKCVMLSEITFNMVTYILCKMIHYNIVSGSLTNTLGYMLIMLVYTVSWRKQRCLFFVFWMM